jgi:hypothetical protein
MLNLVLNPVPSFYHVILQNILLTKIFESEHPKIDSTIPMIPWRVDHTWGTMFFSPIPSDKVPQFAFEEPSRIHNPWCPTDRKVGFKLG